MASDEKYRGVSSAGGVMASRWGQVLSSPFSSLSQRDFRLLWIGQVGQASSMWAEQVARNWLTWEMTESGVALGLVNLFRAIPMLSLGLFGGVAADRFDKRKLLMVIQTWSLLVYILMAVLILADWIKLWHIYVTALALGVGMAFNQPVRSSFVPQLVDEKHLLKALSLNSVAINSTRLIGPALIGLLIAFRGVGLAYVVSVVLYLGIMVATAMIHTPSHRCSGDARQSVLRELVEGLEFLARNRVVLLLVVLALGPLAIGFSYLTLLPIFVTEVLHRGPGAFGFLLSVGAVGALVAGLTLASLGDVRHRGWLMLATGVSTVWVWWPWEPFDGP